MASGKVRRSGRTNRDAFVRPSDNIGRFGNAEVGTLVGPGTTVFSMTIGKRFATGGRSHARAEVAFSNLFNIEISTSTLVAEHHIVDVLALYAVRQAGFT